MCVVAVLDFDFGGGNLIRYRRDFFPKLLVLAPQVRDRYNQIPNETVQNLLWHLCHINPPFHPLDGTW